MQPGARIPRGKTCMSVRDVLYCWSEINVRQSVDNIRLRFVLWNKRMELWFENWFGSGDGDSRQHMCQSIGFLSLCFIELSFGHASDLGQNLTCRILLKPSHGYTSGDLEGSIHLRNVGQVYLRHQHWAGNVALAFTLPQPDWKTQFRSHLQYSPFHRSMPVCKYTLSRWIMICCSFPPRGLLEEKTLFFATAQVRDITLRR